MRTDGSLVGTRWGPISAIGPQPRRRYAQEMQAGTPTTPWRSRRLPRTLRAGDPRRTLFRTLLRRADGVPVELADGSAGTVVDVVFSALGFDFWPRALLVATPEGRLRVPVAAIRRIDVRTPRIVLGPLSGELLERDRGRRDERDGEERPRLQRRHDLVREGVLPRGHRQRAVAPVGSR